MALNIYLSNSSDDEVTEENILYQTHEGKRGSWRTKLLWLRNDSNLVYYKNVKLSIELDFVSVKPNISEYGIVYQLHPGQIEPTYAEWEALPFHNVITIGDIGTADEADITTYYPFWLRTFIPGTTKVGLIKDAQINISALEYVI